MKRLFALILILLFSSSYAINPITDICWECVFPIHVSGVNTTPGYKDQTSYSSRVCFCAGVPPKAGIPLSFWEPALLIDVTRHPYKLIGLGGIKVGKESVKKMGSVRSSEATSGNSFYHVHLYKYPILSILEMFQDFTTCLDKEEIAVAYMSELDPLWNDDHLALIINPEAGFFANKAAQAACIADCASSSYGKVLDSLFWCAGCEGSLYPFSGNVAHHVGPIQASSLLAHRLIAKLHRSFLLKGFGSDEFCESKMMPIIKKSLYKTQIVHPIPQTKGQCHPLGKSDSLWGLSKSYPKGGEDFVYLIWRKKQCCLDAVKPAIGGGI